MINLNGLYVYYALIACIALISLFGLFIFKYRTFKEIKLANVVNDMSMLQNKYYGALSNDKFLKYPEIKKQIEKTLNIYSASIKNSDYNFKDVLVIRKRNVSYEGLADSDLFKELQKASKTPGILNDIIKLNSSIKEELLILKKPIRYRLDLIFQNMVLHSLKLIVCVLQTFKAEPDIGKYLDKLYKYEGKYDIADA